MSETRSEGGGQEDLAGFALTISDEGVVRGAVLRCVSEA